MAERRKLSDILSEGERKQYFAGWKDVKAADDFSPLPPGEYIATITDGYAFKAKKGTPGYKFTFTVQEGPETGRKFWHDVWLTELAKPQTKRELDRLGITDPDRQLAGPPPAGIRCRVKLSLRADDDGTDRNKIVRLKVVAIEPPQPDAFAPADPVEGEPPADAANLPGRNGEGKELFAFGANNNGPYAGGH